jgi:hypothetical protein
MSKAPRAFVLERSETSIFQTGRGTRRQARLAEGVTGKDQNEGEEG